MQWDILIDVDPGWEKFCFSCFPRVAQWVVNPHPTVLSWRHLISTDGIRYSWAFVLSLATFPDQPLSLVEIRAFKDHPWRGACQQWLRRLTWIIYLGQSTRAHSSCVSTANNEAGEDAFTLNTLLEAVRHFRSVIMDAGSRGTTAHAHQCCIIQSYAKTVPSRMKLTMREPANHDNRQGVTSYSQQRIPS